jgi:hypothetical protein
LDLAPRSPLNVVQQGVRGVVEREPLRGRNRCRTRSRRESPSAAAPSPFDDRGAFECVRRDCAKFVAPGAAGGVDQRAPSEPDAVYAGSYLAERGVERRLCDHRGDEAEFDRTVRVERCTAGGSFGVFSSICR